jgi:hypothetical protein
VLAGRPPGVEHLVPSAAGVVAVEEIAHRCIVIPSSGEGVSLRSTAWCKFLCKP